MSYIHDVRRKPFVPLSGCPKRSVDYKALLTGSYTVLLTVGDMHATDDLRLFA